jgi:RNA polymerase sigma-70 factor (ECF subfamily)
MEDALSRQSVLSEPKLVATNDVTTPDAQFVALVNRQSGFIFRIAYAVLRNYQDAEDVVQETFLKLYRSGAWHDIRDEPGFLARVAWRIAVGRIIPRGRDPLDMEIASQECNPEVAAMDADWNAIVHRLIDALPEDLRQPLALFALEELDSPQIATIIGIPEGTVRTRIMRARSILKQKLARYKEGHRE